MPGIAGLVFKQFGWTASIAILTSLVVARLLTPMMAAYMLSAKPRPEQADGPVMRRYLHAVRACLRHPWRTCIASAVFFGFSLWLASLLPRSAERRGGKACVSTC